MKNVAIRVILGILIVTMMSLSLTGCDLFWGDPDRAWTIMVWLDGDNNLDAAALEDLNEMERGLYRALQYDDELLMKLSVVVQYDSLTTGNQARYLVKPDATENSTIVSEKLGAISEPNMGDATELKSFIDFCKEEYPAENYALILWNHGGGVRSIKEAVSPFTRGICSDDTDDGDQLYVGEIKDILTSAQSVDFLGMDACLMGMVEIAYEFRPDSGDFGAQAMSFSPATEQGDGWDYSRMFNRFSGSDWYDSELDLCYDIEDLTPQQFAALTAKEYGDSLGGASQYDYETQTAVDLTKIAALKSAVDAFAVQIADKESSLAAYQNYGGAAGGFVYFDNYDINEWLEYAGFDLYSIAKAVFLNTATYDSAERSAANALMTAVDDAVLYSWAGNGYSGFEQGKHGLSIFFPDGDSIESAVLNGYTYWDYQYFYSGLPHSSIVTWAGGYGLSTNYGGIDFCNGDNDGTVDGWFEMLQYWFNPSKDTTVHPGPMY